jgi:hypothetical protein
LASDAIEGSAVSVVVVDVLPTGEEFGGGGGRPIELYGIIGIGAGAGAVLIAPLP